MPADDPRLILLRPRVGSFDVDNAAGTLTLRLGAETVWIDPAPALLPRQVMTVRRRVRAGDVVHAFSPQALTVSLAAGASRVVYSLDEPPGPTQLRWLRAAMMYRRVTVACSSQLVWKSLVARGVPIDSCVLVRPGVALPAAVEAGLTLRSRLGFDYADRVLIAPLPRSPRSGQDLAMWASSLLQVLDARFKLLLVTRGPASESESDLAKRLIDPSALRFVDSLDAATPLPVAFAAADATLLTPRGPVPPALFAAAMTSGKPIVATTTPQLCEFVEDRHTALLTRDPSARQIAQRVVDLFADQSAAWKLQDRARAEAYDYFTRSKFVDAIRKVYGGDAGSVAAA
jgi:glycosyltransferase involved in cell wall biosynthesis